MCAVSGRSILSSILRCLPVHRCECRGHPACARGAQSVAVLWLPLFLCSALVFALPATLLLVKWMAGGVSFRAASKSAVPPPTRSTARSTSRRRTSMHAPHSPQLSQPLGHTRVTAQRSMATRMLVRRNDLVGSVCRSRTVCVGRGERTSPLSLGVVMRVL